MPFTLLISENLVHRKLSFRKNLFPAIRWTEVTCPLTRVQEFYQLEDVSEIEAMPEKGLRVLQAAVVDAGGNPGVYVSLARVMQQAEVPDLEELLQIAEYLWA